MLRQSIPATLQTPSPNTVWIHYLPRRKYKLAVINKCSDITILITASNRIKSKVVNKPIRFIFKPHGDIPV